MKDLFGELTPLSELKDAPEILAQLKVIAEKREQE